MNNKNKVLVVLILFFPISFIYCLGGEWQAMIIFLIASIVSILIINSDKIKSIGVSKDSVELKLKDINEAVEKADAATEELNVTIGQLNETINPLLDFSLGMLEKDGEFDGVTKFQYIEPFLYSSIDMYKRMGRISNQTEHLLNKGFQKLVYSFEYEVQRLAPEIKNQFRENCKIYPSVQINYEKLREISSGISREDVREYYLNLLSRVERFEAYYEKEI